MPVIAKAKRAANLANPVTTAVTFKQNDDSSLNAVVRIPPDLLVSGKVFRIRASGTATTGGAYTFQPMIQVGSSTTLASNTDFMQASARSISTATRPWYIEGKFHWDSTSGRLSGDFRALNSETEDDRAVQTTVATGQTAASGLVFSVSALFGTTHADNVARLSEFVIIEE